MEAGAKYVCALLESRRLSQNTRALKRLREAKSAAINILDEHARDSLLASIANERANLFMKLGYQDSGLYFAADAYNRKLNLYGPNHPSTVTSLTTLGYAFFNQSKYQKADSIRANVVKLRLRSPSITNKNNHGVAYTNRAESRLFLDDLAGAQRNIQLAYAAYADLERQAANIAATLELETQIALRRQDFPAAAIHIERAITLARTEYQSPHRELGKLYNRAAEVQLLAGRPDSALWLYHTALRNFCPAFHATARNSLPESFELGQEVHTFVSLSGMAHAWEAIDTLSSIDSAVACYRTAFEYSDDLRRKFSTIRQQLDLMSMNMPEFERAIRMSLRAGRRAEVFEWIERSKANDLLDELTRLDILHPELLPDEIMEQGLAFRDSLADAHCPPDRPYEDERCRWRDSISILLDTIRQRYPGFMPKAHTFATITQMQASTALPDSALFISYFIGDSSVYISAFNAWRDTCLEVRGLHELKQEVSHLLAILQDSDPSNGDVDGARRLYAQSAYRIYEQLIAPVLPIHSQAKGLPRRLIIAPDAELSFIPFAALLDSLVSNPPLWRRLPYMGKHWIITYVHSATHLSELSDMQKNRARGILPGILGLGTNIADTTATLLNCEKEVAKAVEIMGGTGLLKQDASESALKDPNGQHDILHVASHGVVDDNSPFNSHVMLHRDSIEDGLLHAFEVFKLNLVARMAILNACQTGRGQAVRGQGVLSMGYAFQVAKCPTVVMSLWDINDKTTEKLFTSFYSQLSQSKTAAEALYWGSMEYLDNDRDDGDDFYHPSYWAPFVMVGDGEQVFMAQPRPWWMSLLWFVWVPPLLLLLWLRWRRRRYDF